MFYNNAFTNSFAQHFLVPINKTIAIRGLLLRWMTIKYVVITITRWTCPNMRPNVTIKNEHKITLGNHNGNGMQFKCMQIKLSDWMHLRVILEIETLSILRILLQRQISTQTTFPRLLSWKRKTLISYVNGALKQGRRNALIHVWCSGALALEEEKE